MCEMLKTQALTESQNEPLPQYASFAAVGWFHLAGLCVKARFGQWFVPGRGPSNQVQKLLGSGVRGCK